MVVTSGLAVVAGGGKREESVKEYGFNYARRINPRDSLVNIISIVNNSMLILKNFIRA